MPIFDFFCSCGKIKEELVKDSDEVVTCEDCGYKMVRGLSSPNLIGFDSNGTSKSGKDGKGKANR